MANIIPSDKPSIYDQLRLTASALDSSGAYRAIVRPDNPPNGIGGYMFDIDMDSEITITSDITDHYIEQNDAINDNWANKPEEITLDGLVGELILYAVPAPVPQSTIANPIPNIPDYEPELTDQAEQEQAAIKANADLSADSVASSQSIYGYFVDHADKDQIRTAQTTAYAYFYQLWKGRQLVSVETPWGIMENMAITSMTTRQGPDTKLASDFSVSFKKVRYVTELVINEGQLAGRVTAQRSDVTEKGNLGKKQLTPAQSASWAASLFNYVEKSTPTPTP